jgi:phosphatidylserine/phosphatidylglycerophosphate/cardiolipin synthase-like enzyme
VAVRLVSESDNLEQAEFRTLEIAGAGVRADDAPGLMHNKFVVIDRQEVWTGSMNLTYSGLYRDNNNLLRVRSPELAQDYLAEFEEMFLRGCFGAGPATSDTCSITPYPRLTLDDTALEVYFSPDDGIAARLAELINSAQESIYFLAYTFTAEDISNAMLDRAKEGLIVSGVFEESQVSSYIGAYSVYGLMRTAGLDVHLDGNPGNMHHKVIILDGKTVITGSYNFSRNAETHNDENVLILYNPQIAAAYLAEFKRIYTEARP